MSEIPNSIDYALKKRLSDPFIGPYILFFLTCNWRVLIYATSGLDAHVKIEKIANEIYKDFPTTGISFGTPLLITSLYIFLWPYVSTKIEEFKRAREIDRDNKLLEKENNRYSISRQIEALNQQINQLNNKGSDFANRINDLNLQIRGQNSLIAIITYMIEAKDLTKQDAIVELKNASSEIKKINQIPLNMKLIGQYSGSDKDVIIENSQLINNLLQLKFLLKEIPKSNEVKF